jgi:cerevisin
MLHHRSIIFALIALSAANALADFHPGQDDHVIKDHYIVVMNHQHRRRSAQFQSTDATPSSDDLPSGMKVKHTYDFEHDEEPLVGYSAHMDADTLQQVLSRDDVAYVERDRTVYALGVQKDAPWGVARIAHRERPSRWSGESRRYPYVDSAGEGVDVYVIDTGINIQHEDFGGRATWGTLKKQ